MLATLLMLMLLVPAALFCALVFGAIFSAIRHHPLRPWWRLLDGPRY